MAKPSKEVAPPKTRKEILEALGSYQRRGSFEIESDSFLAEAIMNETDRGFIVVVGSFVEDVLQLQILEQFQPISRTLRKDLTRSGGPLGTWAQQINLALAMGIIDDDDAGDLEVFKAMRNACAHSRQLIDFNTPELRDAAALLMVPEVSDLPREDNWRQVIRMMMAYNVVYLCKRITQEARKKTPRERYRDWYKKSPKAGPREASPQKPKRRQSKDANQDRPKPKPRRPRQSSRA